MKNEGIGFTKAVDLAKIDYEIRELPLETLAPDEVRVKVLATAVNPVDTKMQETYAGPDFRILGFDACGEIVEVGSQVAAAGKFKIGQRIYYSGQQMRSGSNQRYQAVKAELVALAPQNLTAAQAASLPLTAITAGERLQDCFNLPMKPGSGAGKTLFIVNGAGGVGSILIQLAKILGLTVITTASRPETQDWCRKMGADIVLNHHQDLDQQVAELSPAQGKNLDKFDFIAILHSTNAYWDFATRHIAPFGKVASIVETTGPVDLAPLKNIGAQFCWEFMFAKGNYGVRMAEQGDFLGQLSQWIEAGQIQPTLTKVYQGFSAENLAQATHDVSQNNMIGKVAVTFD